MTVTFKFLDNRALTQKVALTVADMAFDMSEVIEKQRPVHAKSYLVPRADDLIWLNAGQFGMGEYDLHPKGSPDGISGLGRTEIAPRHLFGSGLGRFLLCEKVIRT